MEFPDNIQPEKIKLPGKMDVKNGRKKWPFFTKNDPKIKLYLDELSGTAAKEIKDMFNLFDINSDGLITKEYF